MTPQPWPLVLLHGFTQSHHQLVGFAMQLSARTDHRSVTLIDLPGHGLSGTDRRSIAEAATEAVRLGGGGDYVGYSMGGRTALHSALLAPHLVRRLVVIGATAGIENDDERADRRRADEHLAERIETIGVDAFVDEWLAGPLWSNLPDDPIDRIYRRRNSATGLAHSLRTAGTGAQESLWNRLAEITQPVLIAVGEHDVKFTAIADRLAELLPNADVAIVPSAGHAAHIEQPVETADIVARWLATTAHALPPVG